MSPSGFDKGGAGLRQWVPKLIVADTPVVGAQVASTSDAAPQVLEVIQPAVLEQAAPSPPPMPPEPVIAEPDPQMLDQARAEGYQLGLAEGAHQAGQRALQEVQDLRALLEGMGRMRAELEAALAEEVLSLATAMARQIVRQAFALRPDAILPVLRDALQVLPAINQQTVMHLHPEDAALVKPLLERDTVLAQTTWRVIEDARMERGGCRLETPESEVDATLPARWSRVLAALGREDNWSAS